ncbi:hypothetical protein OSTOST_04287 [Ostertagia ostertagi]
MILITALLFLSFLNANAQTSKVESMTEYMRNATEELHQRLNKSLEWNEKLEKEADDESRTPQKRNSRTVYLKLGGAKRVRNGNLEDAYLGAIQRFFNRNKTEVDNIIPRSKYGCGGTLKTKSKDENEMQSVYVLCLYGSTTSPTSQCK